jgi:recombination protein RecA
MVNPARATLESALRARQLDRTLTTALPALERSDASALAAMDIAGLDACLDGGLPRGQLSELAGPHSSGRTTLLLHLIAAATRRGEIAALMDTCDRLDVASAAAAGVDLDRLLWIRGASSDVCLQSPVTRTGFVSQVPGVPGAASVAGSLVDRAIKAFTLVLQAGGFGVVALDLADVPRAVLGRLPFTTWLRVQRMIEGSETACVLVVNEPLARSPGGVTLQLAGRTTWAGGSDGSRHLAGLDMRVRVVSPRRRVNGEVIAHLGVGALERQGRDL